MKNVANKKTERKYKLNKTLLVIEKVINIKDQIIRLLSFSITIQYGDRLECQPGHRFFTDDLCRNEPINARQLRANGVWSRLLNNFLKGLRDRTCKPLKSQRIFDAKIDAFGFSTRLVYKCAKGTRLRSGWLLRPRIVIVLQPLTSQLCLVATRWLTCLPDPRTFWDTWPSWPT